MVIFLNFNGHKIVLKIGCAQWRNVAPVAPASPGGAMRRGRQNFELKLFGCKNVPYVGQINVRWWGKIFGGTKSSRGRQKASGGAKNIQGAQEAYKKNRKNSGDLFFFFFFFFFLGDSKKITL